MAFPDNTLEIAIQMKFPEGHHIIICPMVIAQPAEGVGASFLAISRVRVQNGKAAVGQEVRAGFPETNNLCEVLDVHLSMRGRRASSAPNNKYFVSFWNWIHGLMSPPAMKDLPTLVRFYLTSERAALYPYTKQ